MSRFFFVFVSPKNRPVIFYILAFAPLLLISYYHSIKTSSALIISAYGFLLLLLKKRNLFPHREANRVQKVLGITIMFSSFFVYFALAPIFPHVTPYNVANYIVYIFGLFLTFFHISALKEAFTPIFLIVAATSVSSISDWLEPHFSQYIPNYVYIIEVILKTLGVKVTTYVNSPNSVLVTIYTLQGGKINAAFVWWCIGVRSLLIFSTILVIMLFEDTCKFQTKVLWSAIGILGTFALNIIRVTIIFLTDYFYGAEAGANVHVAIGYVLFMTWLTCFLYMFSKRQAIIGKIRLVWNKRVRYLSNSIRTRFLKTRTVRTKDKTMVTPLNNSHNRSTQRRRA